MNDGTAKMLRATINATPGVNQEMRMAMLAILDGRPSPTAAEQGSLLLTPKELCRELKISRQSLWRLQTSGMIPVVQIRGATRYRRADIEALIQNAARQMA